MWAGRGDCAAYAAHPLASLAKILYMRHWICDSEDPNITLDAVMLTSGNKLYRGRFGTCLQCAYTDVINVVDINIGVIFKNLQR